PARDVLEDDAAPALAVPLAEEAQGRLDALGVVVGRLGELVDGERPRRDDEQRLDRAGELVDRVRGDQPERTFHCRLLSASGREILIGANGAAWARTSSFRLRSSSSARNATATSVRVSPSTSWSKSTRERRRRSERQRSRKRATGGNDRPMCAVEGAG